MELPDGDTLKTLASTIAQGPLKEETYDFEAPDDQAGKTIEQQQPRHHTIGLQSPPHWSLVSTAVAFTTQRNLKHYVH